MSHVTSYYFHLVVQEHSKKELQLPNQWVNGKAEHIQGRHKDNNRATIYSCKCADLSFKVMSLCYFIAVFKDA